MESCNHDGIKLKDLFLDICYESRDIFIHANCPKCKEKLNKYQLEQAGYELVKVSDEQR